MFVCLFVFPLKSNHENEVEGEEKEREDERERSQEEERKKRKEKNQKDSGRHSVALAEWPEAGRVEGAAEAAVGWRQRLGGVESGGGGNIPWFLERLTALSLSLQITQPAKAREQLVNQLKTQIVDLERFIEYLQKEGIEGECEGCLVCGFACAFHC